MPKKKIKRRSGIIINTSHYQRERIKTYYVEKFFNKFLSKYEFTGLSYQQIAFMMRQFWSLGTVALSKPLFKGNISEETDDPYFKIVITPWVLQNTYNIYNFPNEVRLINLRGVSFINMNSLKLDEEAVIGYIQKDQKGVYANIEPMIEKLVDFEMTIRTNLKAQKTPWMFGVDPENEDKMKNLWDNLDSDDPKLFVPIENLQVAKALVSGATYNIDKLEQQRQQVENEILTRLGINNIGLMEKKEHFTVGEVDSNQEQIQSSGDEFLTCMQEMFDRCEKALGYSISVKEKETECEINYQEDDNEGDNEDGNE